MSPAERSPRSLPWLTVLVAGGLVLLGRAVLVPHTARVPRHRPAGAPWARVSPGPDAMSLPAVSLPAAHATDPAAPLDGHSDRPVLPDPADAATGVHATPASFRRTTPASPR